MTLSIVSHWLAIKTAFIDGFSRQYVSATLSGVVHIDPLLALSQSTTFKLFVSQSPACISPTKGQ